MQFVEKISRCLSGKDITYHMVLDDDIRPNVSEW